MPGASSESSLAEEEFQSDGRCERRVLRDGACGTVRIDRMKRGVENLAMLKTAPIATGEANISNPSSAEIVNTPQVASTGVLVRLSTLLHHLLPGSAPSLLYANTTRVAVTVQPSPTNLGTISHCFR